MNSVAHCVFSILLGLALAVYGLAHALTRYPDPEVFAQAGRALPTLGAVLVFALGVAAALAGVAVLFLSVRRLRRRWRHPRTPAGPRGMPGGRGYHGGYDGDGGYGGVDEQEWAGGGVYR